MFKSYVKNLLKIGLLVFGFSFFVGLRADFCLGADDLMEKAFSAVDGYDTIINLGNTKNAVGDEVLREGVSVAANVSHRKVKVSAEKKIPLIARVTKFLLRMTIVLSITMVIYSGIQYIIQSASGGDTKGSTKNIGLIIGGILLALFSVLIIQLLNSITFSSISF